MSDQNQHSTAKSVPSETGQTSDAGNAAQNSGKTLGKRVMPKGKPFEKGDPRINKGGRPKKPLLTEAFEEMLDEKLNDPEQRKVFIEAHWMKLLGKGVVSTMLLEKVLDRTEGKLVTPVDVSGSLDIGTILEQFRNK